MTIHILGVSAYYHDSAAGIITDGRVTAAVQEERFTRKKHDSGFPRNAVNFCLEKAGVNLTDVAYVVFYDKPLIKFERLLETYLSYAPRGLRSFLAAMPVWIKEKLFIKKTLKSELSGLANVSENALPKLMFSEHHQSHAASAFFPSPFENAGVLCLDGVGEWATTSVWSGQGNRLLPHWEIQFPHSLGLLYSAFTYYTGFKVNSGEYKLMGLAPYGEPRYVQRIYDRLIQVKPDGSFRLNMKYFSYAEGLTMTNRHFNVLFDGPPRTPESTITQKEMDLARSVQVVTEDVILKIARTIKEKLNSENLCLAGGVALNCVATSRLIHEKLFKNIWVQPAAGDAGGALGAAYAVWHQYLKKPRHTDGRTDASRGSYLGPVYGSNDIAAYLNSVGAVFREMDDDDLLPKIAALIAGEHVVGWYQGRMEFGPRALGNRSIVGDPRSSKMQSEMNLKIKYRESFRPFAPSVKAEAAADWFDCEGMEGPSPYMLVTARLKKSKCLPESSLAEPVSGLDKLNVRRSVIPAVTHVDYSARLQTVHKETNPRYWRLIDIFDQMTGCPVLINTSFNVRGEPIVNTPEDAYRCFMRTEMDYLVMENILLAKSDQPARDEDDSWKQEFELD